MEELLAWYNLVFELPFIAGLLYLLLLASGLGVSEHEAEADFDHDLDVMEGVADHDIGIEHTGTDFGHHDHNHEVGHHNEPGSLAKALSFLGLGKVPISILMLSLCFVWGFTGWASNQLLKDVLRIPELYFWISLIIAASSSIFGTSFLARALAKVMPGTESYATVAKELEGKRATALFDITNSSGTARLRDQHLNLLDVPCRIGTGEEEIRAGTPLVLMRYDNQERVYIARPDRLALTANSAR
ncbi:MAG: DUF1449 family protein [Anaplasmataceae bacterium]|nr:DUF1449 family protein [Anaplasmataceae bacterium]